MIQASRRILLAGLLLAGLPAARAAAAADTQPAVDIGLTYDADVLSNVSGGIRRATTAFDNLGITADVDGEQAWRIPGLTLHGQVISDQGGKLNGDSVGSLQGVDNIEVPANRVQVFEAWAEKSFDHDRYSVKAGRYDVNSEFYVTPSSQLFLNPAFGIGAELAQSNPSIFPASAFGVRGKVRVSRQISAQALVIGVPGAQTTPSGTRMQAIESDWQNRQGKVGIGAWRYTRATPRVDSPQRGKNHGAYLIAEHILCPNAPDTDRAARVFIRFGMADPTLNAIQDNLSVGINMPVPGQPKDRIGLAVTRAGLSNDYLAAQALQGVPAHRAETTLEATWRHQAARHVWLQPDLQFIRHPDTSASLADAWVIGGRIELDF